MMLDQKPMSSVLGRSLLLLVGLLFLGCNAPSGTKSSVPDNDVKSTVLNSDWTRTEWLQAADGFSAKPETMPRLNNPTSQPIFEKLVTTEVWINHDWHIFESNDGPEFVRFFPTTKKLTLALMSLGAVDEMIALGLYNQTVYKAFIQSGTDFIAHLPGDDSTKINRQSGLNKVRLGAAISVCELLYLVIDASSKYQAIAFKKLAQDASYSFHSKEGLQLIIATLDERLIKSGPSSLQTQYQSIRSVVSTEYEKRSELPTLKRVTYQGLGPPAQSSLKPETLVSIAGQFRVDTWPGGLVSTVKFRQLDGSNAVQHRIELQYENSRFEAICFDDKNEEELATQFLRFGFIPQKSQYSGRWFAMKKAGSDVRIRIIFVSGRVCVASVEGPSGEVPPIHIQSFLTSLRAAP